MVAAFTEVHAATQAFKKGWVASLLPSDFAPKFNTLYVIDDAFEFKKMNLNEKKTKHQKVTKALGILLFFFPLC